MIHRERQMSPTSEFYRIIENLLGLFKEKKRHKKESCDQGKQLLNRAEREKEKNKDLEH